MDSVSRRLAAAAMGLAFGLSRDEELEKTRLDLERARMEREDLRTSSGILLDECEKFHQYEEENVFLEHDLHIAKGMIVAAHRSKGKCRRTKEMMQEYYDYEYENEEEQNTLLGIASTEMRRKRRNREIIQDNIARMRRYEASLQQPSASSSQQPSASSSQQPS